MRLLTDEEIEEKLETGWDGLDDVDLIKFVQRYAANAIRDDVMKIIRRYSEQKAVTKYYDAFKEIESYFSEAPK